MWNKKKCSFISTYGMYRWESSGCNGSWSEWINKFALGNKSFIVFSSALVIACSSITVREIILFHRTLGHLPLEETIQTLCTTHFRSSWWGLYLSFTIHSLPRINQETVKTSVITFLRAQPRFVSLL